MNDAAVTVLQQAIRYLQLTFIPIFFVIILIGFVFFLIALKNPYNKRKGYVFTIGGFIALLFFTYGPAFIVYYTKPKEAQLVPQDSSIFIIAETTQHIGWNFFNVVWAISEPIIFGMFYIGIFLILLSAKSPLLKRIGYACMIFSPLVWLSFKLAQPIYNFFI